MHTAVNSNMVKHLKKKHTMPTKWSTKAENFQITHKCQIEFTLPEFHPGREIEWNVYVDDSPPLMYDMIIGCDLLMH